MPWILTASARRDFALCVCADDGSTPVWPTFADALDAASTLDLERATPVEANEDMHLTQPTPFSPTMQFIAARRELKLLLTARGRKQLRL